MSRISGSPCACADLKGHARGEHSAQERDHDEGAERDLDLAALMLLDRSIDRARCSRHITLTR